MNATILDEEKHPDLPDDDFREWQRRLRCRFDDMREHFGVEVLEDPCFQSLGTFQEDGAVEFQEPQNTEGIVDVVRCFMSLAAAAESTLVPAPRRRGLALICNSSGDATDNGGASEAAGDAAPPQQTDAPSAYASLAFRDPHKQVRLVELVPGSATDPIQLNLFNIKAVGSRPFEALSYVWGARDADVTVSVNGSPFEVSANLAKALHCLRPAGDSASRVLWIDAISINQADDAEKSAQVAMMGDIYRTADRVVIFLGEAGDDSDLVMSYLDLDDSLQEAPQAAAPGGVEGEVEDKAAKLAAEVAARITALRFDPARFLSAADAFFRRPWWSRMWVVQEFALARQDPIWYCGARGASTARMRSRLGQLYSYLIAQAMPIRGNPDFASRVGIRDDYLPMYSRRWNVNQLLKMPPSGDAPAPHPSHLMVKMVYRESTDPRDRIYALRGLLDPISREVLAPDYLASADYVFTRLAAFLLVCDEWGQMYSLQHRGPSPHTPSWVPDFAFPFSIHANANLTEYLKTASWARKGCRLSIYRGVLGISAVDVDRLEHVYPLEDAHDPFERLRRFWALETRLQTMQPSEPLPDSAALARSTVPFSNLVSDLEAAGSKAFATVFPAMLNIPGFLECTIESLKLSFLRTPACTPEGLGCATWREEVGSWIRSTVNDDNRRWGALIQMTIHNVGADNLFVGAAYDYENFKAQISSTEFRPGEDRSAAGRSEEGQKSDYKPQYTGIQGLMQRATSPQEFGELKLGILGLIDKVHGIVLQHAANRGTPAGQLLSDLTATLQAFWGRFTTGFGTLHDNCTCPEPEKSKHQRFLLACIGLTEKTASTVEAGILSSELRRQAGSFDQAPGSHLASKRQYTGLFVTRRGFVGGTFQRDHRLRPGNKLMLLRGFQAPWILEEAADGDAHRMKSVVTVVGATQWDADGLVDSGVFKRVSLKIR